MVVRRDALVSALPRGGIPAGVVSGLWLPGGLEGGLKGLLGVGKLLSRQSLRQNLHKHPLLPLFLAFISSSAVTHISCVAKTEAVVTSGPLLPPVPHWVRGYLGRRVRSLARCAVVSSCPLLV